MAVVVDTCSLVMIAKNYLPLNENNSLFTFIKQSFDNKELLLLDTICNEARGTSKGIALKKMPFLDDKKITIQTNDLFPVSAKKFDNMVDNNFCVRLLRNDLTEEEYIQQKSEFMKSGDAKIVIYSWLTKQRLNSILNDYSVMTEETRNQNDGKLFKKLPLLCDFLGVKTITAADYLQKNGFRIER